SPPATPHLPSFPTRRSSDLDALALLGRQHGGLAQGPLRPGVAGLAVAGAGALPGRLLHGATEAGVGAELLPRVEAADGVDLQKEDRKSTRLNSSHVAISYAV